MVQEITAEELKARLDAKENLFILDVREPFEADISSMGGTLIPLGQLMDRVQELEHVKDVEFVIHCRSGARSADACRRLMSVGFKHPKNLVGGINYWAKVIDTTLPVY